MTDQPAQSAPSAELIQFCLMRIQQLREDCHGNYNGGHNEKETIEAFHHGMDTVCNVLAGHSRTPELGSLYLFAEAYAALRTAQLEQDLRDEKEERKSFEQGWLIEKEKLATAETALSEARSMISTYGDVKASLDLIEKRTRERTIQECAKVIEDSHYKPFTQDDNPYVSHTQSEYLASKLRVLLTSSASGATSSSTKERQK